MELSSLYRDIVETSPDGLWVFDLEGRTLFANPEMARMLGVPQAEMASMTVFDSLDETGRGQMRDHLEEVRRGRLSEDPEEVQLVDRDGTLRWTLVRESVLRDDDGRLTAVLHRFSPYDVRRAMIAELRDSREQLAEAQRIARIGHWTWDVARDEINGSASLFELYGLDPDAFPVPYAAFLDIVHPDDRTDVDEAVRSALSGLDEFGFEARVQGEHDWVWTRGRGVVRRDEQGLATSMSGTHQDISHSKEIELALVDSVSQNALMQSVASAANEARSLVQVLSHARDLVLLHDDWRRGRAFLPDVHGKLQPLYVSDEDRAEDLADAAQSRTECELARRAFDERRVLWDADRLTIAFPVVHDGTPYAALVITSAPPLYRHDMIEQMVEIVATQLTRVIERELAERRLAEARDAAMEASRQKSEFLATMSHEIRTPLNGVIGLNGLLLQSELDTEQERLASGVQLASKALLAVINDVLDFSKIEAGRLDLEHVAFAVPSLFTQLESMLGEAARAQGIDLRIVTDGLPETLVGDPTRLLQVLTNLVSNAIKFTEHGYVELVAAGDPTADGRIRFTVEVTDTGVGVPAEAVSRLFTPFRQGDASTTRVYGGTGLGLAISKEIVDALGGEIGYRPRPHGGSTFHFTAVLERDDTEAGAPDPDEQMLEHDGRPEEVDRRVLVVEDNEINQMVAVGVLESLGYQADVAADGVEALAAIEHTGYDVVLMDVQMPRMDGYSATRAIRQREHESGAGRLPVVAMTAGVVDGERERCLAAGMDRFLTKPVDPASLAAVLIEALELGRAASSRATSGATPDTERPDARTPDDRRDTDKSDTVVLDTERLRELRKLDDVAAGYLDRAIANFSVRSGDLVRDMRTAMRREDGRGLRYASHRLVGTALNLGAGAVAEASRVVEALADDGTVVGASGPIDEVERRLTATIRALEAYQAS